MTDRTDFGADCVALLRELTDGQTVDKRGFLKMAGALGLSAALFRFTPAEAADKEIVLCNWGGDAVGAMADAFAKPFDGKKLGLQTKVIGGSPSSGAIKSMVESGKVTWDVCDRNMPAALELGRQGLLEKIDYGIVDKSKVRPEHASEWGVGNYIFANVLAWDTKAFGGRAPKSWADFWNVKDFPGKRTLRKHFDGQLEGALLADGVPVDKLYPLDVDRALDKIKQIKQHTIFWGSGAESQQLFRDGEVVMGNLFSTRASVIRRDTDARVEYTFDGGIAWVGAWIVLKNNPAGKDAFRLVASSQDPEGQVLLFQLLGNGPVNPAAAPLVPADMRRFDPGSPENYAKQIPADAEWYAKNSATVLNRYIEAIS